MNIEPHDDPNRPMPGGGWISGSSTGGPEPEPAYSAIVAAAVTALSAFGGDLDDYTAARLLPMWSRFKELTDDEMALVIVYFGSD